MRVLVRRTTHRFLTAATLMWRWGSGCQLEAPNDLACLRLQILGKDHLLCDASAAQGGQGGSSSRLLHKNEHGHEYYLTQPDVKEGPALGKEPRCSNEPAYPYSTPFLSVSAAKNEGLLWGSYAPNCLACRYTETTSPPSIFNYSTRFITSSNFVKSRIPNIGACR
ncbi:hypothetical protein DFP73DRAFT_526748 [Morchella snyderi]|nr:hypothetical protein DFP73DRAFT_526748 [Morchella snyderi]